MIAILISFLFGAFEAFMLKKLLFYFTSADYMKAVIFMIIKLACYAVAIAVLVLWFRDSVINCAIGFSLGLPLSVTVWFIYNALRVKSSASGDDSDENNNNN